MTSTDNNKVAKIPKPKMSSSLEKIWSRFQRNKIAMVALGFIIFEVLMAVFAPFIAPYDPLYTDYAAAYQGPTKAHWLGADDLGRDVLSRIIYGARVSYAVGVLSQIFVVIIGLPIGAITGLVGGKLDYIIMRIIDILSSVPGLLLYILLMVALGAGLFNMLLAMSITGWIGIARLVRGQVLSIKQTDYVRAARAMGGNTKHIFFTHLIRNTSTPVIVSMALGVPGAMFAEAGLSFLGLGIAPPTASWGQMIGLYQGLLRTSPHLLIFPAVVLAVTMLAWTLLGDGVRDALDPNIRS